MAKEKLGLVHVYTGDGKGKTSAAVGLALRAVGQGLNVYIIQFMKGGCYTGELIAGKNFLPNIEMIQYGKGCIKEQKQIKLHGFGNIPETQEAIEGMNKAIEEMDKIEGVDETKVDETKEGENGKERLEKENGKEWEKEDPNYKFFDFIRDDIECGNCRHCFVNDEEQIRFIKDAFDRAKKITQSGDYDLVILDEINIAVKLGFIRLDNVLSLIDNKEKNTELVLTGRHAPKELMDRADYVSNIQMIKHPYQKGIGARRGVEY